MVQSQSLMSFLMLISAVSILSSMISRSLAEVNSTTIAPPNTTVVGPEGPFDCVKIMMRAAKKTMKTLSVCSQQVKATTSSNKEYAEKLPCIMKCVMAKIGLLDKDFMVDDHSVERMLKAYIPSEKLMEEVQNAVVKKCEKFAKGLDHKEENCKSYGEYTLCLQMAVEDYKDSSPMCIKKKKKEGA